MKLFAQPHVALLAALITGGFTLGACGAASPSTKPPGTILAEHGHELGFGSNAVSRSQVNSPGSFEGVGHFTFVYFHDEEICQCGASEVAIAPDGSRLLYTDTTTGKLMLFRSDTRARVELTQEFVGYPADATWDLAARKAVVQLQYGNRATIDVPL